MLALRALHRDLAQVVWRDDRQNVADREVLVRCVEEPSGADHGAGRELQETRVQRVRGGLHHALQRHVVGLHALRIGEHVQLLQVLAPERDVRHAATHGAAVALIFQ